MSPRSSARTIDECIAEAPPQAREAMAQVRAIVRAVAPEATETIAYAMPTFDLDGKHLVHFAGYARHIGLYPLPAAIRTFSGELKRYKHAKGSIQFPLDELLPVDLIRRIVEYRVRERRGEG
jgi:uncharacterized protein YdhG (YjbR/CyaY superfamily)